MHFIPLLGRALKSDEIIDVLEDWDAEVVYDFDRLHENMPDKYWATAEAEGVQLQFDENQNLITIFLYQAEIEEFTPINLEGCDVPVFDNIADAGHYGERSQAKVTNGHADVLGVERDWVKLVFQRHSIHYEFRAGLLALVTISDL